MQIRLIRLTVVLLVVAPLNSFFAATTAQDVLRLELGQAIDLALIRNLEINLARDDLQTFYNNLQKAESEFSLQVTPEVSVDASGTGDNTSVGASLTKKYTYGATVEARALTARDLLEDSFGEQFRIEIRQPLLRRYGPLINAEPIVQAGNEVKSALRHYEALKTDLVLSVVRSFENVIRLEAQLEADKQSLQRLQALLIATRSKEQLGRASRIDVLRVELQSGQAQTRVSAGRQRIVIARQALLELIGKDLGAALDLVTPEIPLVDIPSVEEALEVALANRLDYAQILQDLEDRKRGVKIAERRLLPNLNVVGRYEFRPDAIDEEDESIWFVGLQSDFDLNRQSRRIDYQQAILNNNNFLRTIKIFKISLARELQETILQLKTSQLELDVLKDNKEHAQSRLDLARRLYELGRSDNFTVMDAETAFTDAQSQLLSGRSAVVIDAYTMKKSLGNLIEIPDELKPQ